MYEQLRILARRQLRRTGGDRALTTFVERHILVDEETAGALDLSPRTVKRDWQKALAFLYHELAR